MDPNELRAKLRPVFDTFDTDKSGSISTTEMGHVLKAVKMELSKHELARLMKEADPDGSGEIDFDEVPTQKLEPGLQPPTHASCTCTPLL